MPLLGSILCWHNLPAVLGTVLTHCIHVFSPSAIALFISFIINLFVICVFGAVSAVLLPVYRNDMPD